MPNSIPSPYGWASASAPLSTAVVIARAPPELLDRHQVEHRRDRDAQDLPAASGPQSERGGIRIVPVPGDGGVRLLDQHRLAARLELLVVLQPSGGFGDALEQRPDEPRSGEQVGEAMRSTRRVPQIPQEPGRLPQIVGQPPEREQPVVGIRALGEPLQHHRQQVALDRRPPRHPAGERRDVVQRTRGSRNPMAASLASAWSLVSAKPSSGSAATAESSGR